MIEVISENKEEEELFSGSISFYTLYCREIASYSYEEGKEYISSLNSTSFFTPHLKSASYEEGDCSISCLINFLDEIFTNKGILIFALLLVLHMQKVLVYLFVYFALVPRHYTVWKNVVKFSDALVTNKTEIF